MTAESDPQAPGVLYVEHLNEFALHEWKPLRAAERCPSLERAVRVLRRLG